MLQISVFLTPWLRLSTFFAHSPHFDPSLFISSMWWPETCHIIPPNHTETRPRGCTWRCPRLSHATFAFWPPSGRVCPHEERHPSLSLALRCPKLSTTSACSCAPPWSNHPAHPHSESSTPTPPSIPSPFHCCRAPRFHRSHHPKQDLTQRMDLVLPTPSLCDYILSGVVPHSHLS